MYSLVITEEVLAASQVVASATAVAVFGIATTEEGVVIEAGVVTAEGAAVVDAAVETVEEEADSEE